MVKRGTFIQSHALNLTNNSEGSARIIFMPVVGTRDVSWGTVADLWVELKNLDNVVLRPVSSFFTSQVRFCRLPVSINELRPSKPQTELIGVFFP